MRLKAAVDLPLGGIQDGLQAAPPAVTAPLASNSGGLLTRGCAAARRMARDAELLPANTLRIKRLGRFSEKESTEGQALGRVE